MKQNNQYIRLLIVLVAGMLFLLGSKPTPIAGECGKVTIRNYEKSVESITQLYYREHNTTIWQKHTLQSNITAGGSSSLSLACGKEYDFKAVYANDKDAVRESYRMGGAETFVDFWMYHSTIPDENIDCSEEGQNKMIYDVMHDAYLWYAFTPELDYTSYKDQDKLLDDLLYHQYDKWSYLISLEFYNAYYESGTYGGLGYSLAYEEDRVYVMYVYQDSPAGRAGLKRGVEILAINGKTIQEIDENDLWGTISGKDELGVEVNLTINRDSKVEDITLIKGEVTVNTVLEDKVLQIDGKKIGYLLFESFIEPSRDELKIVFEKFQQEAIDELIIDLRYNGGGRLDVARYLASLISGTQTKDKIFETLEYNDRYTHWNNSDLFSDEKIDLNLDSLYIITTQDTASASESLINGLKPFLNVYLIGSNTDGKPVGMRGYDFCDTHLSPIQFKVVNANSEGDYFDGLEVECSVEDDTKYAFGDINEPMLKEALFYLQNQTCSKELRTKSQKPKYTTKGIYQGFRREIGAL